MPKEKVALSVLKEYIPEESFDDVLHYIQHHKVQLTVTRQRESILGDYRHAHRGKGHRISVNGNLNKYSFLIILLHELAHLFTFELYGSGVVSHGREWKQEFRKILATFISKKVFPASIEDALRRTLDNPAATSCGDENLLRVLREFDPVKEGHLLVEQLHEGQVFSIPGNRRFKKGPRIRKRFKCQELATGKLYFFSPVYEVRVVAE